MGWEATQRLWSKGRKDGLGHPEDLPAPLSFMAKSWKPLGKMAVSGTGGGSQDRGPSLAADAPKRAIFPHRKLQGSPWHPLRKAIIVWLLQMSCSSDSLCFGTVCPAGCHFSCPLHLRQGNVHSVCSSELFTSAAIIRCRKPHSKGLFAVHAARI